MSQNRYPPDEYEIIEYIEDGSGGNNRGCLYGLLGMGGCLAIVIVAVAVPILLGVTTISNTIDNLVSIFRPPSDARVVSAQTIVTGIRPLGDLVTIRTQLAKADLDIQVSQTALNLCGHSAQYVAEGTVEAGVDLTAFSEASFSFNQLTNTYTVRLPSPKLTSCRIDFIRQYSNSFTACNVDFDLARILAQHVAITSFARESIEAGILARAEQQAGLILTNFIKTLTGSEVIIEFTQESETVFDTSCQPLAPAGWVYVAEEGVWRQEY